MAQPSYQLTLESGRILLAHRPMNYVVLARKWRPMSFRDLVGQDHVSKTLGNAIAQGRVAHAFLFTGVRGVGKTTSARILAKALNCMGPSATPGEGAGPTVDPCLVCPACREIAAGVDIDVQEIDGASHNGVDEVRKLQDSLPYRPSRDRYKIVIVDEVHMLSQAAWNAFLKTLEEPPPHVKFIFATTEVHKVPITILSRVQRFDFKLISARAIGDRLRYVLDQETIGADEASIAILARQAAGSMRDAMSLLDQVIAFGGAELRGEDVAQVLGVASSRALFGVASAVLQGHPEECLELIAELGDAGYDMSHVTRDLLALLRDLAVAKVAPNAPHLLDRTAEEVREIATLSREASESDLLRLHQSFSKNYDEVVRSSDPRAGLEMLLVRLALRPPLLPVDELLHRLAHLERRLLGDNSRRPPTAEQRRPARSVPHTSTDMRETRTRETQAKVPSDRREPSTAEEDPEPAPPLSLDTPPKPAAPLVAPAKPEALAAEHAVNEAPPQAPPIATPTPLTSRPQTPPSTISAQPHPFSTSAEFDAHLPGSVPEPPSALESFEPPQLRGTAPPNPEPSPLLDWTLEFSDALRAVNAELSSYIDQLTPISYDASHLELAAERGFIFERALSKPESSEILDQVARVLWGATARVTLRLNHPEAKPELTVAALRARQKQLRHEEALRQVRVHPKVQEALKILDADLVQVRPALEGEA